MKFFFDRQTPPPQDNGGQAIRGDEAMAGIDKKAADDAIRRGVGQILKPFLLSQGFSPWRTNKFVRVNPLCHLEYIDLQKEYYGSKTFTANLAVMPLYLPGQTVVALNVGERLGCFAYGHDHWWDFKDPAAADTSLRDVCALLAKYGLPWFQEVSAPRAYLSLVDKNNRYSRLGVYCIRWVVYFHLRDQRVDRALDFLKREEGKLERSSGQIWYAAGIKLCRELTALCEGLTDCKGYIRQCTLDTLSALKLPAPLCRAAEGYLP